MLAFCRVRFPSLGNDTAERSEWSEGGYSPLKVVPENGNFGKLLLRDAPSQAGEVTEIATLRAL
jgi:hypothetical protein